MKVNRFKLHCFLVHFEQKNSGCFFFSRQSRLRQTLEKLRGDLEQHKRENYAHYYDDLNDNEMFQLIHALKEYIIAENITDMKVIDNRMLHALMSESLLSYELDTNEEDDYKEVVDLYFSTLNNKLHPSQEKNSLSSLDIWLQHVIDNPGLYLHHQFIYGFGNTYFFNDLDLSECGCVNVSHDRLLNDVRLKAEKEVIDQCQRYQSLDPTKPIRMLSLGSGGGLQDFIIILKLFGLGFRHIDLTLIEPDYNDMLNVTEKSVRYWKKDFTHEEVVPNNYYHSNQGELYHIIRALSLLSKSFSDSNLTISQYGSVTDMKKDPGRDPLDLMYAIDFDVYDNDSKAYEDFHALSNCLTDHGTAILSRHHLLERFEVEKANNNPCFKTVLSETFDRIETKFTLRHEEKCFFK